MKLNRKFIQLSLVSFGIFLIFSTYFIYPKIKEKRLKTLDTNKEILKTEKDEIIDTDSEGNLFTNMEYAGVYNVNNSFTVKSEEAYIYNADPEIVHMKNMNVTIYMDDGRKIIITSEKGTYNKENYNCFFKNNVRATDGETVIVSKNLDLISTDNYASVYNNVVLTNEKGSLTADKINYNFKSEVYKITMFDDNEVKIKITE